MSFKRELFLPVTIEDMTRRGWDSYDFLLITADAYVDHPSFGAAVIGRVLEAEGYRVAVMAQPDWKDPAAFTALGRPSLGVLISGGNIDSMVAHYTAAKKRRSDDAYSPGRKAGLRPDHATVVYANRVREVFGDIPIVIGGLEASLRRFAHYDYWEDKVRRSILFDSQADILSYGMGERSIREIAARLSSGTPVSEITDVRGTCVAAKLPTVCAYPRVEVPSFEEVSSDKKAYARANMVEYQEHDAVVGKAVVQKHGRDWLIVNPPAEPLTTKEMDAVAELPYVKEPHPMYDDMGGVPAIEEVRFSVTHNRGCFGACNFCSLAFHQGRTISCRSHESVVREVRALTEHPGFKGYIHDVGGPSATFRRPSCQKQLKCGMCKNRACLAPEPCPNLDADHTDYMMLLRKLRDIPRVKKVFVRSGIRFDYLMKDPSGEFFTDLVQHHISGQLKVAPEHCVAHTLDYMGKPHIEVYEKFREKYQKLNRRYGKEQYLVPYLISSHPGCTLSDAVELAVWLNRQGHMPEQVQDFYPTPGTLATCMWYTGIDPRTMKPVFVPKTPHDKALQRALMQWRKPQNRKLVLEALHKVGREDLIGYGKHCLVRPDKGAPAGSNPKKEEQRGKQGKNAPPRKPSAPGGGAKKAGWAKAKPKNTKGRGINKHK
ncbi:MAG: YgiQ family radical SAM protein [Oscillospiraceae bacterium]|nr:YgiQ family radical SAM protein [Oscillospiraceae bacterium]